MTPRLVLASASPRRRELLGTLGVPFEVAQVDVDERRGDGDGPVRLARRLAIEKALAALVSGRTDAIILAADTVVAHRGDVLGKPADAPEAEVMLRRLRGRTHRVVTAVAVAPPGGRAPLVGHAVTRVMMRRYSDDEIAASIARGDPFDKAGAYAIQDPIFRPVQAYDGCYCNVVGLPLWTAAGLLHRAGMDAAPSQAGMSRQCGACPDSTGTTEARSRTQV